MPHYRYLIVGGGMTADAAARGIRSVDGEGNIGLVGSEPHPPYERPPLSKGLWKGRDPQAIWRDTGELGVDLHLGRTVARIDRGERTATDDRGAVYSYEELLLATGATPVPLRDAVPQVIYLRTWEDYRTLRSRADDGASFAVVGGGFVGSEIAAGLAHAGSKVTLIFPEEGVCARILPEGLALHLNEYYRDRGVDVRAGQKVASVRRSGPQLLIAVEGGDQPALRVEAVVAGLGVSPETTLAENAGLQVDDGIVVDAAFRTDDPHVYAAGDCARFWSPVLGRGMRVEHEDQANSSGMHVGRVMAGEASEYEHIPSFYSDFFDIGYEAVGELDPVEMEVVEEWRGEPYQAGVVYYLRDRRVRGILLWNLRGKLKQARALLRDGRRTSADEVRGSID